MWSHLVDFDSGLVLVISKICHGEGGDIPTWITTYVTRYFGTRVWRVKFSCHLAQIEKWWVFHIFSISERQLWQDTNAVNNWILEGLEAELTRTSEWMTNMDFRFTWQSAESFRLQCQTLCDEYIFKRHCMSLLASTGQMQHWRWPSSCTKQPESSRALDKDFYSLGSVIGIYWRFPSSSPSWSWDLNERNYRLDSKC